MLLPILALGLSTLNHQGQDDETLNSAIILKGPSGDESSRVVQIGKMLKTPELSPKLFNNQHWTFDWETVGYESLIPSKEGSKFARFYVFSQERNPPNDAAMGVTRMLQRMWEYLYKDLGVDHSDAFGDRVVQVFLCKGGVAGGEQRFGLDTVNGKNPYKVNTIYFYDLATFKDPLEMAREVAHEYGHATLAGVNGYSDPEDWANGFLGERVYLKYIAEAMRAKELAPDDAMGVTQEQLDGWLGKNVNPLVAKAAEMGPNVAALKQRDKQGMDNFLGMALYMDTLFPASVFLKSMRFMPSTNAEDYLETCPVAASTPQFGYKLTIPSYLAGKTLWIPLGDSNVKGAQVIARKGDWIKVKPSDGPIEIVPKHSL